MAKKKKVQQNSLSEVLRAAIIESGMNHAALERETGVERMSIGRFVKGQRSLRLDLADKLAAYFGIESRMKGS